ncbi:MAG: hypothetical protein NVS3B14_03830 [Ktedonobacteraceae bacterium]
MMTPSTPSGEEQARDAAYWAQTVSRLKVTSVPSGALNLNVEGRQLVGALQGFGQMWQKTYRVCLKGVKLTPAEVITTWKANFAQFWPRGNRFYAPLTGIAPGEVALINGLIPGDLPVGLPLSTGVMVLYADDESFTFMTPQGHTFAGWITFSAYEEQGDTVIQTQVLMRAFDVVSEIGFRLGAAKSEDAFWKHTLKALAAQFGVDAQVEINKACLDPKVQWAHFWNIWQDGIIRTVLYRMATPLLWVRRRRQR